jgi:hypothetical protein
MQYLIARDGQQLGQFEEEEIRSGLFEGRYLPSDAAWTEGMEEWKPIGEIIGQGVRRVDGSRQGGGGTETSRTTPTKSAGIAIAALALVAVAIVSAMSLGVIGTVGEKKPFKKSLTAGIATARELALAVRLYAADNGGKYPATLEDLTPSGKVTQELLDQFKNFKPDGWLGEPGFEYLGGELNDSSEGGKVLLRSRCWSPDGKRILATNDTSVELEKVPPK